MNTETQQLDNRLIGTFIGRGCCQILADNVVVHRVCDGHANGLQMMDNIIFHCGCDGHVDGLIGLQNMAFGGTSIVSM